MSVQAGRPPWRRRGWMVAVLGVLLVAAAMVFHRSLPSPAAIWETLRSLQPGWALVAVGSQIASLGAYVVQQRGLLHALGGRMSVLQVADLTFARTAMSVTLPAGSVVSTAFAVRRFHRAGVSTGTATALVALTGLQSVATLSALDLVWFVALGLDRARGSVVGEGVVAIAVLAGGAGLWFGTRWVDLRMSRVDAGHQESRPSWRQQVRDAAVAAVHAAASLPARAWVTGTAAAAANWLFDVACLLAVVQACHAAVGLLPAVGAYLAVQLVRQVPVTPGGVGLVEGSLLAALVTGGATVAAASAAVLTYRLLSCWLIVLIGLPATLART